MAMEAENGYRQLPASCSERLPGVSFMPQICNLGLLASACTDIIWNFPIHLSSEAPL
jgi:hypothetical protein